MDTLFGFSQFEIGTAIHDIVTVLYKVINKVFEV